MITIKRYNIRPSKHISLISAVVGIIFVIIGLTTIVPSIGAFGILWTFAAVAITSYHVKNLLSDHGAGIYSIDIEEDNITAAKDNNNLDFDHKLRKLHKLYEDGIISRDEYDQKRHDILDSKW